MQEFNPTRFAAGVSLATFLTCSLSSVASAQISYGGEPAAARFDFQTSAPLVNVESPNVAAYLAEDEAMGYRPLRYGALVDLDITMANGEWTNLPDGSRVWRVRISSEGAKSLAVEFEVFDMPPGAEMYVYGNDPQDFYGSYNMQNANIGGTFVFEPFAGSEITLEVNVPEGVADPVIDTGTVIYDYRDIFGLMDGSVQIDYPGQTGQEGHNCLIDVACPEGDGWDPQKRATMRTLSGGALCSGALMNNTANDGTQYVLTANHCGQSANTIFRFKFERPGCHSGSAPTNFSVSGAQVLSTNSNFDNRLMRITPNIPSNYDPYYAGWTRASGSNTSFAFAMGHPSGNSKKISIDGNGAVRESVYWRVTWSAGTLEGGSSGGPLFDQNGRVRGPACCVNAFNCSQTAYFGRFDRFWTANSIAQYLDPLGSNPTSLDGFDPQNPGCQAPQIYCNSFSNSAGPGANLLFNGTSSISANDLSLTVSGLPASVPGLFFYGTAQSNTPFGKGLLCASGSITRLSVQVSDVLGIVTRNLDLSAPPFSGGGGAAISGETRYFQYWYRDVAGGLLGFNTSDGLRVTWCD